MGRQPGCPSKCPQAPGQGRSPGKSTRAHEVPAANPEDALHGCRCLWAQRWGRAACEPPVRSGPAAPATASALRAGGVVQTGLLRGVSHPRLHGLTPSNELSVTKARGVLAWLRISACRRDTRLQQGRPGALGAGQQPGVCSAVTRANGASDANLRPRFISKTFRRRPSSVSLRSHFLVLLVFCLGNVIGELFLFTKVRTVYSYR